MARAESPPSSLLQIIGRCVVTVICVVIAIAAISHRVAQLKGTKEQVGRARSSVVQDSPNVTRAASGSRPSRLDLLIPEGNPAYTLADLQAWLPEMQREVEALVGRKFKRIPPIKVITRGQLRELLGSDSGKTSRFVDDLPGESEIAAIMVLGLYDPEDGTIYMVPGNLLPLISRHGEVDRQMVLYMAKLVFAHELTHALQDQHLDLRRLMEGAANLEEQQAIRATIEGHASMVEDRIAMRWNLVRRERDEHEHPPVCDHPTDQELLAYVFDFQHLLTDLYYLKGSDFFQHNFDRGGTNQVWRILQEPPKDTAVFMNPARYWQPGPKGPDIDHLFKEAMASFGSNWTQERFTMGAFTLRLMYRKLGRRAGDEFVAAIQSAYVAQAQHAAQHRYASVVMYHLRNTPDPLRFILSMERVAPGALSEMETVKNVAIGTAQVRRLKGLDALHVREMDLQVSFSGGQVVSGRTVRVGRANAVIEITDVGADLNDQRMVEIASSVFERFNSAGVGSR